MIEMKKMDDWLLIQYIKKVLYLKKIQNEVWSITINYDKLNKANLNYFNLLDNIFTQI